VKVVVVALAHSPFTGEESFLVQSAEDVGSNGLDDLSHATDNSKQSHQQLLPSLVMEPPAPFSTGCALTLKGTKRGINKTAHVNHQQRDAKAIRRHKKATSWG
jgi:hypothetical protein